LLVLPATVPVAREWGLIRGFWLAVEVSGRGSRVYDRDFKAAAYLALGVAEVWRADLLNRAIEVTRPPNAVVTSVSDRLVWHPPTLVTPFSLDVPMVFAGIEDDA
jgi:hypothetical protein